jgi:hypothetical protein
MFLLFAYFGTDWVAPIEEPVDFSWGFIAGGMVMIVIALIAVLFSWLTRPAARVIEMVLFVIISVAWWVCYALVITDQPIKSLEQWWGNPDYYAVVILVEQNFNCCGYNDIPDPGCAPWNTTYWKPGCAYEVDYQWRRVKNAVRITCLTCAIVALAPVVIIFMELCKIACCERPTQVWEGKTAQRPNVLPVVMLPVS